MRITELKRKLCPIVNKIKILKPIEGGLCGNINVCYFLVSLNPHVKEIHVGNKYAEFHSEFQKCLNAGMLCKGLSIKIVDEAPIIHAMVPVTL